MEKILPARSRHRTKFYEAFRGNVIEAKADHFGRSLEDARQDLNDPERSSLIIQSFVDELFDFKKIKNVPTVKATVTKDITSDVNIINWNIDFQALSEIAGFDLNFDAGSPLTANAHSNRFISSAASIGCDLYLPRPMSRLVGDKLFESAGRNIKLNNIIQNLQSEVDFPSIRKLVNDGTINFEDIMRIRSKSQKFRSWLQSESERDRNAIVAYHNELARDSGLSKFGRSSLRLFGVIGGGAVGGLIGGAVAGPVGGALGGIAGSAVTFSTEVLAKFDEDWKPVVFGNWLEDRIKNIKK